MKASELVWKIFSAKDEALYDKDLFELAKAFLLNEIKEKALFRGEFILSSGKKSDYYLDLRRITLDSESSALIGYLLLSKIVELDKDIDAVSGPTLGADPIVSAVLTVAPVFGLDLKGLIVRKEEKSHGLKRLIEGPIEKVKKAVCVEDVVTTGGSLIRACKVLKSEGISVNSALVIVDRSEGEANSLFENEGVKLTALFKVSEVLNA